MIIIAITGPSGSGKTTLAKALLDHYGDSASSITSDNYFLPHDQIASCEREAINYDHPDALDWRLFREHLQKLKCGNKIEICCYDFELHRRDSEKIIQIIPKDILIVDGHLLLYQPDIVELFDVKLYMNVPQPICFQRRLKRDTEERGRDRNSVITQYHSHVLPMYEQYIKPTAHLADLLIDNSEQPSDITGIISFISDKVPHTYHMR